jgi:antitoxin component of RelBE/YafQ-DinJ toxin-antitoxin module
MATTKLTLSIDQDTVRWAKQYAEKQHISLSKFIQNYLQSISEKETEPVKIRPLNELPEWIQQLVVAKGPIPDFDHKAEYHKHLEEKYGL